MRKRFVKVERRERHEPVPETDPAMLDTREVRIPVVVCRPCEQQRVFGARNPVEWWAEVEVSELNEWRVRAEQRYGSCWASHRSRRFHGDPVPAGARELIDIKANGLSGG